MNWKEHYSKRVEPHVEDIAAYLPAEIMALYYEFAKHLARELNMTYVKPVYTQSGGWKFQYGRSGMILLNSVTIQEDCFAVQDILVRDASTLAQALQLADRLYREGFEDRFAVFAQKRGEAQKERTRKRIEREQDQVDRLAGQIVPDHFNQYRWCPKVSRQALKRLYASDACGLLDTDLLDDIGYSLYVRCVQGKETYEYITSGKLRCHHCGELLPWANGLMVCSCGQQYLFRDYMRSFRSNNMPSGAASQLFGRFIDEWPAAQTPAEKMRLVDWLVHEFHIDLLTGVKGRCVGINLIEGTKAQIQQLILDLAYGDVGIASNQIREDFRRNLQGA